MNVCVCLCACSEFKAAQETREKQTVRDTLKHLERQSLKQMGVEE